ncbi:uncharacterized protein [Ptychodera flava]|uniref:uncharacterized protein n=1 Tax=Ptychodera flava TaxID=63121 RepID=UPI00396A3B13
MKILFALFIFALISKSEPRERSPEYALPTDGDVIVCVTNIDPSTTAISWNSPFGTSCEIAYGKAKGADIEFQHNQRPPSGSEFVHPRVAANTDYKIAASCSTSQHDKESIVVKSKDMSFQTGTNFNKTKCSNESQSLGPTYEINSQDHDTAIVDHSYGMTVTDLVIGVIVGSIGVGIIIMLAAVVHAQIKKWRRMRRFIRMRNEDEPMNVVTAEDDILASADSQM